MLVPDPVAHVRETMSGFAHPWSLCGGWAVDAWLGRKTRHHDDADVSVLDEHQRSVFAHLSDWRLVGHGPDDDHDDEWDGTPLEGEGHIHARASDGFELEVLLAEHSEDEWVLRREPRVTFPLARSARASVWGVPTVVPEILLFFKATAYFRDGRLAERRERDEQDFRLLLPALSDDARSWLRRSISLVAPDHPLLP